MYKNGLTKELFERGISPETLGQLPIRVYEEFKINTNVIVLMLENGIDFDKIVKLLHEKHTALFELLTNLVLMDKPRENLFEKGVPLIDLFDLTLDKLELLNERLLQNEDNNSWPAAIVDFIKKG